MTADPFVPKIIFFDIDDTLSRSGIIAAHNQATLEQLAKTDIKLVIATGRSKALLPPDIMALFAANVFDAIICANGQYNFDKDSIVSHYPLTQQQAEDITYLCQQRELVYKFDSATHMAWATDTELTRQYCTRNPNAVLDPEYYKTNPVYQCSVIFKNEADQMQEVNFDQYDLKLVCWHQVGGDILPTLASKARGVTDVCQHFAIEVDDAMAFGDGFNDLEMFDLVGYAVAMGDGQPALKQRADFITGTIEEHGIQTVLSHL